MIQTLLGPIVDLVGGHLQRKAEEKKAVHERKMVAIQQDANWENIHTRLWPLRCLGCGRLQRSARVG